MKNLFFYIVILLSFCIENVSSQTSWSFELHGGTVINVPSPLIIHQNGYPDIKLTARYETEPFKLPPYWVWRFSRWSGNKSWELEAIHHKLYLKNPTQEIQQFSISHGLNIVTLNRGIKKGNKIYRAGLGFILAHPETTIRDLRFYEHNGIAELGYYITGPCINLAIAHPINISERFYLNPEFKATLSYAKFPVSNGHARLYNISFHFIIGIGGKFIIKKRV